MKTIQLNNIEDISTEKERLSLVLGNFDGVHIGHVQLILFAKSETKDGKLAILTFDKSLKENGNNKYYLTDLETKSKLFQELGVDYLYVIKTDENLKRMTYDTFVEEVLRKINPSKIFCGPDFKYGYKAEGDVDYLKTKLKDVYVLNYVDDHNGNKISSSGIKEYISQGKIHEANRWLGRFYSIKGIVVKGNGNGRKLGYPTINLHMDFNYVIPKNGVYITKTYVDEVIYNSVTNVGTHPSIDELDESIIETHLLGYEGDLYNKKVEVFFYEWLRDEVRFESLDDLKKKINEDCLDAEHFFAYEKIKSNSAD